MTEAMQGPMGTLGRLSSREQVMVGVLALVLLTVSGGGMTWFVAQRLDRAERRLNERRETLATIESLEGRYRAAELETKRTNDKIKQNPVQLFSLLNRVASELGLKLDNLNERHSPLKDAGIDEVSVEVALKDMSITKLNKFLEKLEGPPHSGLVKVTKLKVKTAFQNDQMLDINMTVSTYRLLGGAGPPAETTPSPAPPAAAPKGKP
jgi:hypothetical protein